MKKLALSLICLFTIALSQDDMNDDMGMKVYIGASSMSASGSSTYWEVVDPGRTIGFNIGLMKPINEKVTVGAGYTKRGWTDESYWVDFDANIDEEWDISGIELWATYNLFNFSNGGNFWVGPSYAILTNVDLEMTNIDNGISVSVDDDIDDNDLSLMLGVSFPFGSNFLNVGYQRSLMKVDDTFLLNQFFIDYSFGL